jgi:hypothetical protein
VKLTTSLKLLPRSRKLGPIHSVPTKCFTKSAEGQLTTAIRYSRHCAQLSESEAAAPRVSNVRNRSKCVVCVRLGPFILRQRAHGGDRIGS